MPSAAKVALHWRRRTIACFLCGAVAECWNDLERAHLIDRWAGGLDGAQNLVLLCGFCHRIQPIFEPGDEARALEWVFTPLRRSCPMGWLELELGAENLHKWLAA